MKPFAALVAMLLAATSAAAVRLPAPAVAPAARSSPHAPQIPVERFAAQPFLTAPSLSPSGRWIAAKIRTGEAERLVVYDREGAKDKSFKMPPITGQFGWYGWAGDRLLIEVRQISDLISIMVPMSRLAVFDPVTGGMKSLGGGVGLLGASVIHLDADSRFVLVASSKTTTAKPGVERIDLATGEVVQVEKPAKGIMRWLADAQGNVRAGMSFGTAR